MNTILQEFVKGKLGRYAEPQRAGTPRGDRIGFPKVKYNAALLQLTNFQQTTIASDLKVSCGLLYKWRWEQEFKELVDKLHIEFTDVFMRTVRAKCQEKQRLDAKFFAKPIDEIATTRMPTVSYDEFRDAGNYGHRLRSEIRKEFDKVLQEAIEKNDIPLMATLFDVAYVLTYYSLVADGIPPDEAQRHAREQYDLASLKDKANSVILREIKAILMRPAISDDERKRGVYWVSVLERLFEGK